MRFWRRKTACLVLAAFALPGAGWSGLHAQERTWEYSVQISAAVQTSPPRITLSWPQDVNGTPINYVVRRKAKDAGTWGSVATLPGHATSFEDVDVVVGAAYEYEVRKRTLWYDGYGYVFAGIEAPLMDDRGTVVLVVDATLAAPLEIELARLEQDLWGDGWTVRRLDVARDATPASVRALIKAEYDSEPGRVKSVFLFGHVPIACSGDIAPDGHTEEQGAWPADMYYGEMTSEWTDFQVNRATALSSRRWNVPGDGKFDPSTSPSAIELEVGRVDLFAMPGRKEWMGSPTFPDEVELLRNYLNKNHAFRHKHFTAEARGLVYDGAGARDGQAYAATAWRNFAPFFGADQIRVVGQNEFLPVLGAESYLWSYAVDSGDSQSISHLGGTGNFDGGRTTDFVEMDVKTVFAMLLGSHLGDWAVEDNVMRSILATPSYGLVCVYGGAPHWFLHHMALGETIGYGTRLTQNNTVNGLYQTETNQAVGLVHVALMGDPTLRLHPVAPVSNLSATSTPAGVHLNWSPSTDSVLGYHVYRASSSTGPFTRLTGSLLTETSFVDSTHQGGTYMVRAIKLQASASGTYLNPSQGMFATVEAAVDSDQDGMMDSDESVAGTNPNDPASVLRVLSAEPAAEGVRIIWSSVPGKTYRIAGKFALSEGSWTDLTGDIPSAGETTEWLLPEDGTRFHRVRVVP